MPGIASLMKRLAKNEGGNIAILTAVTAPALMVTIALGVDLGNIMLQRRSLQNDADLASIVAASRINDPEQAVFEQFQANGRNFAVRSGDDLLTANGKVAFNDKTVFNSFKAYADVVLGRYTADSTVVPDNRFVAGQTPYNAVKVLLHEKSDVLFASFVSPAPTLEADATATSFKVASFSVGSRLASLDNGLINGILGSLLGTKLTLSVMDYQALLNADVDALKLTDQLGLDLGVTAGTYQDLLNTKITYKQFLASLMKTGGISSSVSGILNRLQQSLNTTQVNLRLADLFDLGPLDQRPIGSGNSFLVGASVFDLVNGAAAAANGGKQVTVDLGATVPGLATTQLKIAIGMPPSSTPMLEVGMPGSIARTSQTRVSLTASVDGLSAISGIKVKIPLYVSVANAQAALSKINCLGGAKNNASVDVTALPGVAEIALGSVDDTTFSSFGSALQPTKTPIVSSALLTVNGVADVKIENMNSKTLTFSPTDISTGTVKTVSTSDATTSLVASMLGKLSLDVNVLFITLGTPQAVQNALVQTLAVATVPLDNVLYNTLLVLGIRIGAADVRVTGVSCQRPVLVN